VPDEAHFLEPLEAGGQHLLEPPAQVDAAIVDRLCRAVTGRIEHETPHARKPAHKRRPVRCAEAEAMQEHRRFSSVDLYHSRLQMRPCERERVDGWEQPASPKDMRLGFGVAPIH